MCRLDAEHDTRDFGNDVTHLDICMQDSDCKAYAVVLFTFLCMLLVCGFFCCFYHTDA